MEDQAEGKKNKKEKKQRRNETQIEYEKQEEVRWEKILI